jgi:putative ABC transport system permease protein
MLISDIRIVFRQFTKNKLFSVINIIGLTAGITVCLFVAQFAWFEWSFERFNANADRIYRVNLYNTSNGVFDKISAGTVSGLAYAMKQNLAGIESIARVSSKTTAIVANREKQIEHLETTIVYADPSVIDILGIDLIDSQRQQAPKDPRSVVISESIARKYFADTNITGRILEIGFPGANIEIKPYQIAGVFKDIPANTHRRFDFIIPPQNEQSWNENWAWSNVTTYVTLQHNITPQDLKAGLAKIVKQHHQDDTGDRYLLEPLTQIRLHAFDGSGRSVIVNFFMILGGVILLLALLNYINLSTARFFERIKEIGVRKIVGAGRRQLILQLLTESFLFNTIAFACAGLLFFASWPWVVHRLDIPSSGIFFYEPLGLGLILVSIIIVTMLSGFYPALFLSSFKPLQSLKGKINEFADRSTLRKTLVILQLSISLILITGIFAIEKQISFMRGQQIGISIDQMLIIEAPLLTDATFVQRYEPFKNEILRLPNVSGVTCASSFPGSEIDWHRTDITLGEENAGYRYDSRIISIGTEFLDVFELPLLTGRNFNPGLEGDSKSMLINEEASQMFGFKNFNEALNKFIFIGSRKFEIIGVVKNYHFRSFQHQLQPILFLQEYFPRNPRYAIKMEHGSIAETLGQIESKWKEAYEGNVFRYHFLDDQFQQQYAADEQMRTVVAGLSFLAIIIFCLGLFGLSLYSVTRRTKEIGIRKVLGASALNMVALLSRDYLRFILIGVVIGIPLVYQGVNFWLEGYAYQIEINVWLFIWPVILITILTMATISARTLKAANMNPVDSIKYE